MDIHSDSHISPLRKEPHSSDKKHPPSPHDSVARLISEYWNDFRREVIDKPSST